MSGFKQTYHVLTFPNDCEGRLAFATGKHDQETESNAAILPVASSRNGSREPASVTEGNRCHHSGPNGPRVSRCPFQRGVKIMRVAIDRFSRFAEVIDFAKSPKSSKASIGYKIGTKI